MKKLFLSFLGLMMTVAPATVLAKAPESMDFAETKARTITRIERRMYKVDVINDRLAYTEYIDQGVIDSISAELNEAYASLSAIKIEIDNVDNFEDLISILESIKTHYEKYRPWVVKGQSVLAMNRDYRRNAIFERNKERANKIADKLESEGHDVSEVRTLISSAESLDEEAMKNAKSAYEKSQSLEWTGDIYTFRPQVKEIREGFTESKDLYIDVGKVIGEVFKLLKSIGA